MKSLFTKYLDDAVMSTSFNAPSNYVGTIGAEGKPGHRENKKRENLGKKGRKKLQKKVVGDQSNDNLDNDASNRKKINL